MLYSAATRVDLLATFMARRTAMGNVMVMSCSFGLYDHGSVAGRVLRKVAITQMAKFYACVHEYIGWSQ